MATERNILYRIGDESHDAYLIKNGAVYVRTPSLEEKNISAANLLVGTVELFLEEESKIPPRIFELKVDADADISIISFDTVLELAEKHEFGYSTNRFMANLIEKTNNELQMKRSRMPKEWGLFEERAKTYVKILDIILNLWHNTGVSEYERFVNNKKKSKLYQMGEIFEREQIFGNVSVTSKDAEKFLHTYAKDEVICKKNDAANCMYILLKGSIGVVAGGNYVASIRQTGEAFGELSLFLQGQRTAGLVAETETSVYVVKKEDMKTFHASHPYMFIQIARTLAHRLEQNLRNLHLLYAQHDTPQKNASLTKKVEKAGEDLILLYEDFKKFRRLTSNPQLGKVLEKIAGLPAVASLLRKQGK